MKFFLLINKWANFYFFIQNLSEWHFSNRKDYNMLWRKELGRFSTKEENALRLFKKIRLKYQATRSCFEQAFFLSKQPWQVLKTSLSTEEYRIIKETFDLFKNKFNLLYKKELPLLKKWQKQLNKKINNSSLTKPIVNTLSIVYNTPPSKKAVKIYLLFSTAKHTGGGANIDEGSISLEISRCPLEKTNHAVGIIWHEIIHLCFDKEYLHPLLRRTLSNKLEKWSLIIEIAATSLFPKGILGVEFLKLSSPKILHSKIPPKTTDDALLIMQDYILQRKTLDEDYIKKIISLIETPSKK